MTELLALEATAISTVVMALATIWLAVGTVRAAQATMRADLYDRYSQRWDGPIMMKRRARLAEELCKQAKNSEASIPDRASEDVYDFFEEVGLLLRKHLLDKDFVWEMFGHYATFYWKIDARQYGSQPSEKTLYSNYGFLVDRMAEITKRKETPQYAAQFDNKEKQENFLINE